MNRFNSNYTYHAYNSAHFIPLLKYFYSFGVLFGPLFTLRSGLLFSRSLETEGWYLRLAFFVADFGSLDLGKSVLVLRETRGTVACLMFACPFLLKCKRDIFSLA